MEQSVAESPSADTEQVVGRDRTIVPQPVVLAPVAGAIELPVGNARQWGLDIVRVFASLTVIWHHSIRSPAFRHEAEMLYGTWGTSYFNLLAAFLLVASVRRHPKQSYAEFAAHRFERLYLPFLIWTSIALLARFPNYLLFGRVTGWRPSIHVLWHGGTYHLWFLPYVLVASLVTMPLVRWLLQSRSRMRVGCLLLFATSLAGMVLLTPVAIQLQDSFDEWSMMWGHLVRRYPLFLFGIAAGLATVLWPSILTWLGKLLPVSLVIAAVSVALRQIWGYWPALTIRTGAICALLFGVGLPPFKQPPLLARLGRLSFGVYLCHYIFVEGAISTTRALHVPLDWRHDIGVFVFASVGSFVTVWLLKMSRRTAWVIP